MNKSTIDRLLFACICLENSATTPARRKYWDMQFKRLRALAVKIGWMN